MIRTLIGILTPVSAAAPQLVLVRPMSVLGSALRFAIGNIVGVAVMVPLLDPLGIGRFRDGLRLALLWGPISCVYGVVVVSILRVARLRLPSLLVVFSASLLPFCH